MDRTTPICAGSNMNCCNDCFTPKDGMREPSGYDPSWCACKVPDVDLAEPKQDKEVTVECAGIAGTEYSTSENTPAAARTLEKWTYDSTKRNWAEHAYNEFDGSNQALWTAPGAYKSVMTFNAADQAVHETLTELIYTPASGQGTNGHDGGSWGAQGTQVTSEYDIKYDKHGNLWSDGRKVFNYDVLNRLTGVWAIGVGSPVAKGNPVAAYTYDGYGHRLTARYNTNNNGTLDDDVVDVYSYDHLWRVRTVTRATPHSSGGEGGGTTWTSYIREQWFYHNSDDPSQYKQGSDAPVMRRINTTGNVDANGNSIFDTTQNFVTDRQGSVVAILGAATAVDPNNDSLGGKPGPVVAYVHYDTYGTPIISDPADINRDGRVDASDSGAYIQYWQAYHANTANSYRYKEILDFDKDGTVATHSGDTATAPDPNNADFHALSDRILAAQVDAPVAEKLGNLPLYCGYWWDQDLEMYHVRHRVYRPQWGKWIQRDPLGYLAGWNLYEYVGGEPWRFIDPLGLYEENPYRGSWDAVGSAPRTDSGRKLGRSLVRFAEAAAESAANAFKGALRAPYDLAVWYASVEIQVVTALASGDIEGAKGALKQAWNDVTKTYDNIVDGVSDFLLVTLVAPEEFSEEDRAAAWGGLVGNIIGSAAAGVVTEGIGLLGRAAGAGLEAAEGCGGLCFVAGTQVATADGSEAIEDITPGERVLSQDDPNAPSEDEPDQRTWCLYHIRMQDQGSGSVYEVDVLKPASWLLELSSMSETGTDVMYGLEEEGVYGPAKLIGVEQCPPITKGEGRIVLAAIRSQSNNVYDLKLSNSTEELHPTGPHRFYSIDRSDWIATQDLHQGERIKSSSGETVVERVGQIRGLYPVFNITVQRDHCYYVGSTRVLTHNDRCSGPTSRTGEVRFKTWKRGEPIDKPMPDGTEPTWETVRERYWRNRYDHATKNMNGEFSEANLELMRNGNAPQDYNPRTGKWESRELHHAVWPQRDGGPNSPGNLWEVTPDQHRELDPYRR